MAKRSKGRGGRSDRAIFFDEELQDHLRLALAFALPAQLSEEQLQAGQFGKGAATWLASLL